MTQANPVRSFELRFLTAEDADAYSRIRLEALERDPEAFSSSVEEHRALSLNDVKARLSSHPEDNFVVGSFVDGHLVGTAGFYRERGSKTHHKGRVWGVYLRRDMRGRGIGRAMMQAILERAVKISGLDQILISVTSTQQAAAALYRALGFISFGLEMKALKIGDRYIDEDYMVLHLGESSPR